MANSEHVAQLSKGKDEWNAGRTQDAGQTIVDLTGANLSARDLAGYDLSGVRLVRARLVGTDLTRASLVGADLSLATLTQAKLHGADLERAKLRRAGLERAEFDVLRTLPGRIAAPFRWSWHQIRRALGAAERRPPTRAILKNAALDGADLRGATGLRLDANSVRGTRFSASASDLWSRLRRGYTGPWLLFNVLFLLVFLAPYAARAGAYMGLEVLQDGLVAAGAVTSGFGAAASREVPVWKVVLGTDRGALYLTGAVLLIAHNFIRVCLTVVVAGMRESEERSGVTPSYSREPDGSRWSGYGWLRVPYGLARVTGLFAIVSFLLHAWSWLQLTVRVPVGP